LSRSFKAHLLLVAVTMVWGATFTVIKDALREISPLLFNAVRMTLASVCLAALYWKPVRAMDRSTFRAGIILGIFLWLGYEFQTSGLKITTPSKSAFITGLSVILVPVILAIFFKSRLNLWTSGGVVAALFGLFLMTVPAGEGGADWASVNVGDLLTLGCAVAFAFHIVLMGRFTKRYPFQPLAVLQTATAAILMSFTIPVFEHPHATWNPRVIAAILVTGLVATAAAFTIQAWAQQFTPATHTALIFALEPVFAWLTAYLVEGEKLGMRATIGALLILAGVLLSELKGSSGPIAEPV
jgi:drug/metabolite transporter (DMT)-like permease